MAFRMTLAGDTEMKAKLRGVAREFPLEARRGTGVVAQQKLELAQERCPVKSGKLQASGKKSVSIRKSGATPNILATVKFGGPGIPYARIVHETHPTKSKFLESVMLEAVPTIGADLAREIDLKKAMR